MQRRSMLWALVMIGTAAGCSTGNRSAADTADPIGVNSAGLDRAAGGALFTLSNEADGNRVLSLRRDADGRLSAPIGYATGGNGSGDSLASQGALVLTEGHRFLIAVDPGSDAVTSFAEDGGALERIDHVSSGGSRPVSVTERRGLVYVLNAGAPANVRGFTLDFSGHLHPISTAGGALSAADVGPAQVQLSNDARNLVVTEKATDVIDTFAVGPFGRLGQRVEHASAGQVPYGFAVTRNGTLIVSEAASGSMSSYDLDRRGALSVVSAVVPDTQAAPCWVALSGDQRVAFTTNAASASISSYRVSRSGEIALADARAADLGEGATPLDMAIDRGGRRLYVLDRGNAEIAALSLSRDGTLSPLDIEGGLPSYASGLAAY